MTSTDEKPTRFLRTRQVSARYSITPRTVDRWTVSGVLPPPIKLNGIRHWRETDLEQVERERMAGNKEPAA